MKPISSDAITSLLRARGARVTVPRRLVLQLLCAADCALTHQEVEARLSRTRAVDRVTLYRVLEWLSRNGLAHKIAGEDRVWRYNASTHADDSGHAHFSCSGCGTTTCLDDPVAPVRVVLPAGYVTEQVELTIKGRCSHCAGKTRAPRSRRSRSRA